MNRFTSRKLLIAFLFVVIVVGNRLFNIGLTEHEVWAIVAVLGSYIGGQSVVDLKNGKVE